MTVTTPECVTTLPPPSDVTRCHEGRHGDSKQSREGAQVSRGIISQEEEGALHSMHTSVVFVVCCQL